MSRLSREVKTINEENELQQDKIVRNFMNGESYKVSPILRLKLMTASSIFGEPQYYRKGGLRDSVYSSNIKDNIFKNEKHMTSTELMTKVIKEALDFDFKATINWARVLREEYNMRFNPQVIMVQAAIHPNRVKFTKEYPGQFAWINSRVMSRADEPLVQLNYYLYINKGKKNNLPDILKRNWNNKLSRLSAYQIKKYLNAESGMINTIRICHANSPVIDELMKTGNVTITDDEITWEKYISENGSNKETWEYVIDNIFTKPTRKRKQISNMFKFEGKNYIAYNHMAILRNLRNMINNVDVHHMMLVLSALKASVLTGKQFPFRYYSAMNAIQSASFKNEYNSNKSMTIDTLEECMDISLENMKKLKGRTVCLSDNSGSAWDTINSEYGTVNIAEIANLSSVITAKNSDEGYVVKFGDTKKKYDINKRNGVLSQALNISKDGYHDVGAGTEGGIWEFFYDAIENKIHFDNIFIYSDEQAGTGGLYGTRKHKTQYKHLGFSIGYEHINVYKLVLEYRKKVNPKVNVFSVQVAGYDNSILPEYSYRTNLLYGWTGKESEFAAQIINIWDMEENKNE